LCTRFQAIGSPRLSSAISRTSSGLSPIARVVGLLRAAVAIRAGNLLFRHVDLVHEGDGLLCIAGG
jgi:hypothetical protein